MTSFLTIFITIFAILGGMVYLDIHFNDAKIIKKVLSKINSLIE